jgi:drug/metabolite transporter (DMT)-like permease
MRRVFGKGKKMGNSKNMLGYWLMFLVALLFSLGGLLIKLVPWDPIAINGFRSIVAVLVIGLARRSFKIKLNRLTLVSAVSLSITNVLFVMANKMTLAANAIVLQYTSPIYILLLGMVVFKVKPHRTKWIVVTMAMGGMVLFFLDKLNGGMLLGNIYALLSGVTYAMVFFFSAHDQVEPQEAIMLAGMISFTLGLPFYWSQPALNTGGWISILTLGVVQQGLAYLCFSYGIKMISSINANLICLSEALMSACLVWIVLKEKPGPFAMIGGTIIILAILLNIGIDYYYQAKAAKIAA